VPLVMDGLLVPSYPLSYGTLLAEIWFRV